MAKQTKYYVSSHELMRLVLDENQKWKLHNCCGGTGFAVAMKPARYLTVTISCDKCGLKLEKPIDRTTDHVLADTEKLIRQWEALVSKQ